LLAGPWHSSLTELGLIDEYRIYLHPSCWVTASRISPDRGRRFASWAHDRIGEDVIRLTYVPA
jgi:hypothetical protein